MRKGRIPILLDYGPCEHLVQAPTQDVWIEKDVLHVRFKSRVHGHHILTKRDRYGNALWSINGDRKTLKGVTPHTKFYEAHNTFGNDGENALLAALFQTGTVPATVYVGLVDTSALTGGTMAKTATMANFDGASNAITTKEPSGNGYARLAYARGTTDWPNAPALNANIITLTGLTKTWTASGGSIPVASIGQFSSAFMTDVASGITSAKLIWFQKLNKPDSIASGNSMDFAPSLSHDGPINEGITELFNWFFRNTVLGGGVSDITQLFVGLADMGTTTINSVPVVNKFPKTATMTNADGSSNAITTKEPTTGGYARLATNRNTTDWPTLQLTGINYEILSKQLVWTPTGGAIGPFNNIFLCEEASSGTAKKLLASLALNTTKTRVTGLAYKVVIHMQFTG